jgi:hypothetical protein
MFTKLLGLLEEFLTFEDIRNYPLIMNRHLLNQYQIRRLDKHFEGLARDTGKLLDKIKIKDSDYFFNTFTLKKDIRTYLESKTAMGKRGELSSDFNDEIKSFMAYFVYKTTRYHIEQLNQQKLFRYDMKLDFDDELSGYLQKFDFTGQPQLEAFYNCLQMLKHPGKKEFYDKLIELISDYEPQFNREDLTLFYIQIFNYTRERYSEGKEEFQRDTFEIIKKMTNYNIYPREMGYMVPQNYIGFVVNALQVNEYEWAEKFMEEYADKVTPAGKNNAYNYAKAYFCYRKKMYSDTLVFLNNVRIEDFNFYLRVKNLMSRTYFELGEFELLLSLLDTFKHYLTSAETIPELHKSRYINYSSYLSRVVNAILSEDKKQMKKILNEIALSPVFENKSWLVEKVLDFVNPS